MGDVHMASIILRLSPAVVAKEVRCHKQKSAVTLHLLLSGVFTVMNVVVCFCDTARSTAANKQFIGRNVALRA